jgi:VWFA-related protein
VRYVFVFAILVCAAASVGSAQNPPPSSQTPVFRTDARLVHVSIVVQDGRGRPVAGLTADDFELFDQGDKQQVTLFSVEGSASSALAAAGTNIITNRLDGPAASGVTVLLYDRLNTRQEHQSIARRHIIEYLRQLRPEDRVGLYVLEGGAVRVLHDFTRDASSLLKAIERAENRTTPELAGSEDLLPRGEDFGLLEDGAAMEQWMAQADAHIQGFFTERRIRATTDAIEGVARHLAGVRGRKNVIWISSGFPIRFNSGIQFGGAMFETSSGPEIFRATRALNDADIAFYTVDARGLVGAFSTPANARQQQFTTLDGVMRDVESSQVIAEQTGGRAYFNTNDLGGAIKRAAEDSRLTYVLGYYPSHAEWDGNFREIKVRVKRRGVSVRHRKGYFALPPEVPAPTERLKAIVEAFKSPLDATGVGLSVSFASGNESDEVALTIRVEPEAVVLTPNGSVWAGSMDVAIAQTLPDGSLVRSLDLTVPLELPEPARRQLLVDGLTLNRTIILRADAHQVKVAVRNDAGAIGTVTIPASRLTPLLKQGRRP